MEWPQCAADRSRSEISNGHDPYAKAPTPAPNRSQIQQVFKLLRKSSDECLELRVIDKKKIFVGYFNDVDAFTKAAEGHHGKAHVYVVLNPLPTAFLHAHDANRLALSAEATKDEDVQRRRWLFIDVDTARGAKNIASTDAEIEMARAVSDSIVNFLRSRDINPIVGMSGNGWHVLVQIPDYPVNGKIVAKEDGLALLLRWLDRQFSTPAAKVDTVTFNPARPCKLYGTAAVKGANTVERPHRTAKLLEVPSTLTSVDVLQVFRAEIDQQRAFEAKDAKGTRARSNVASGDGWYKAFKGDLATLDIVRLFRSSGGYLRSMSGGKHAVRCPWGAEHSTTADSGDTSTVVFEGQGGWPNFKCLHSHCASRGLQEVLEHFGDPVVSDHCDRSFRPVVVESSGGRAPYLPREDGGRPIPLPLRRPVEGGKPFPVDALGADLGEFAGTLQRVTQAPLALACQSALAAVNVAVQAHADVSIDGRRFPLSEFFFTVGDSGERKSSVDRIALAPHRDHERRLAAAYPEELEAYKKALAVYKQEWDAAAKKGKTSAERQSALDSLPDEPLPPLHPMFLTEEPTFEGLQKQLAIGQPSMGLFADEGGRLIGGYGMAAENQVKTAAGFSELWDGKRISRLRSGDGPLLLFGRRVAMHLMAQPMVAQQLLNNPLMVDQGLLSRVLLSWPESTAGTRLKTPGDGADLGAVASIARYNARLGDILSAPVPLVEGKRNELDPRTLTIAGAAKKLWVEAYNNIERQLTKDGPLHAVRGFANKAAEHALRLAGTLSLFADVRADSLGVDVVAAGVVLAQHYIEEHLRLFQAASDDPDLEKAEKLLAWAIKQSGRRFHLAQVYQLGPASVRDAKTARRILEVLEGHFYIYRIDPTVMDGAKRREVWEVTDVAF